jgi:hypothetical protein
MSIDEAKKCYASLPNSENKINAEVLEKHIKYIVEQKTGNKDEWMIREDDSNNKRCKTYVL